jgi:hypothetical protein
MPRAVTTVVMISTVVPLARSIRTMWRCSSVGSRRGRAISAAGGAGRTASMPSSMNARRHTRGMSLRTACARGNLVRQDGIGFAQRDRPAIGSPRCHTLRTSMIDQSR